MNTEKISLGRQPILDGNNNIFGFEVLFRSGGQTRGYGTDFTQASAALILNALSDFGLSEVVGERHKAFFKVNAEMLMSDMIELLPKEQVVIEILGNIEVNGTLFSRCRSLKALGFSLALSDFEAKPDFEPLFDSIEIVKVNLENTSEGDVDRILDSLKGRSLKLLAEKVESAAQFDRMKKLGFQFFQGYYFAKPVLLSGKRVDLANVVVMKLMNQMLMDEGLSEIERTFKESPSLSYNLLTLVNSVSMGTREKINSVRHAIVLLGRERLNRWTQVLLFSNGSSLEHGNPLLNTALMRGRFMELLVQTGAIGGESQTADHAFMAGILSLIDALLAKPMKEVVTQMHLVDAVTVALLNREGQLGHLLSLVEALEKSDDAAIGELTVKCNVDMDKLFKAEEEAAKWTKNLTDSF